MSRSQATDDEGLLSESYLQDPPGTWSPVGRFQVMAFPPPITKTVFSITLTMNPHTRVDGQLRDTGLEVENDVRFAILHRDRCNHPIRRKIQDETFSALNSG